METAKTANESTPQAYKEALDRLSESISACVGEGLLPSSAEEAAAALEQEASMKTKLEAAIESAKQSLRAAIATARSTRESPPLADYLAKRIHTDDVLRYSCADLSKEAKALLKEVRREREQVRWRGACTCTPFQHTITDTAHPIVMIFTFTY